MFSFCFLIVLFLLSPMRCKYCSQNQVTGPTAFATTLIVHSSLGKKQRLYGCPPNEGSKARPTPSGRSAAVCTSGAICSFFPKVSTPLSIFLSWKCIILFLGGILVFNPSIKKLSMSSQHPT